MYPFPHLCTTTTNHHYLFPPSNCYIIYYISSKPISSHPLSAVRQSIWLGGGGVVLPQHSRSERESVLSVLAWPGGWSVTQPSQPLLLLCAPLLDDVGRGAALGGREEGGVHLPGFRKGWCSIPLLGSRIFSTFLSASPWLVVYE